MSVVCVMSTATMSGPLKPCAEALGHEVVGDALRRARGLRAAVGRLRSRLSAGMASVPRMATTPMTATTGAYR